MRFKSAKTDGCRVYAVTGTNTVSFGIDFEDAHTEGLLGFGIERIDKAENQQGIDERQRREHARHSR